MDYILWELPLSVFNQLEHASLVKEGLNVEFISDSEDLADEVEKMLKRYELS